MRARRRGDDGVQPLQRGSPRRARHRPASGGDNGLAVPVRPQRHLDLGPGLLQQRCRQAAHLPIADNEDALIRAAHPAPASRTSRQRVPIDGTPRAIETSVRARLPAVTARRNSAARAASAVPAAWASSIAGRTVRDDPMRSPDICERSPAGHLQQMLGGIVPPASQYTGQMSPPPHQRPGKGAGTVLGPRRSDKALSDCRWKAVRSRRPPAPARWRAAAARSALWKRPAAPAA